MHKIECGKISDTECDFVAEGETVEETKAKYFKHGAEAPIHKEMMEKATDEEKVAFGKKVDEHLASQA